ncbi:hypothetical protein C8F01DRAFT_1264674 [Mycena amicta]|nr:hypothetical protein C8F01DRAFT_1264674 [Mycena amicta]
MSATLDGLPTEIIALICAETDDRCTLASLCRTSRRFVAPMQRILFHEVQLAGSSLRAVLSWCLAVLRHISLAERVRTLSLRLPGTFAPAPKDVTKIAMALKTARSGSPSSRIRASSPGLQRLFAAQSDIRILVVASGYAVPKLAIERNSKEGDAPILPNLIAHRDHLPMEFISPEAFLAYPSRPSMSSSTTGTGSPYRDAWAVIGDILPALIHLAHLAIDARKVSLADYPAPIIARLKQIETFTLVAWNTVFTRGVNGKMTRVQTCPTLRRVVIGTEAPLRSYRIFTATRTPTDDVELIVRVENRIDWDTISMFAAPLVL